MAEKKAAEWSELHQRAANHKGGSDSAYINNFTSRIADKGQCDCKNKFKQWKKKNPPNFQSRDTYFAWTVDAHNAVRRDLKLSEITLDQAKALYYKEYKEQKNDNKNDNKNEEKKNEEDLPKIDDKSNSRDINVEIKPNAQQIRQINRLKGVRNPIGIKYVNTKKFIDVLQKNK